mmetsp:Transcript_13994/g.45681  ORF Transcript_13994/g.45681 Transcript_13994/m.45681 type:complete len:235 (-) Transcript_13994:187-891(-)
MRRSLYRGHLPSSPVQKVVAACGSAVASLWDPRRGDMIGTLGEVTGRVALEKLRRRLLASEAGRALLRERPLIEIAAPRRAGPPTPGSFGAEYEAFMARHGFHAEDRSPVALVDDEELAYVLLRYRQVHDYWHVLCGLPPTLLGELALKWFELVQTELPVAAFSAVFGPLRLSPKDRRALRTTYLPWALREGRNATFLLEVSYERHLHTPIDDFRRSLNLTPAPPKVVARRPST